MNRNQQMTREITFAAILTALSIIITYSPVKLNLSFFTLTLGAHVPTFLAMFISPWVAVMSVIGSCIGFFMAIPAPSNILVMIRAALHIIFTLAGMKMLSKNVNIFLVIILTALMHSLAEGIAVYFLTPVIVANSTSSQLGAGWIALTGTFVHHFIDSAIATPILVALSRAKLINKPYFITKKAGR